MTAPGPASPLRAALESVRAALERGEATAAAAATEAVIARCASDSAPVIDREELERMRTLVARCLAMAAAFQQRLEGELSQAGTGRRAVRAYATLAK